MVNGVSSYTAVSAKVLQAEDERVQLVDRELNDGKPFWCPRKMVEDGGELSADPDLEIDMHIEEWWLAKHTV